MKTHILAALFAAANALGVSSALAANTSGIDLGLRLGYAMPLGDYSKGSSLSKTISGQVPIGVDAGYRFTPNVIVGVAFQYGFGLVRSASNGGCPEGAECSAHDIRAGIQGPVPLQPSAARRSMGRPRARI